jgi:glycosyltransferase involved in cell wall biosynthesis
MKRLQQVISEERVLDRVIFIGELEPDKLRTWYAVSSVVILPSYNEGLGRVVLESQAMKKPVVAYDVGGVAEAIRHGEGGYLVRKGDIEELTSRLKELLEDEGKRYMMGERGRQFVVDKFSLNSLAIRHERFYTRALEK